MSERLIFKVDGFRHLGGFIGKFGHAEHRLRQRSGHFCKLEFAFADDDLVARLERFFELRHAVYKNAVDAAKDLAVFKIAVDELEIRAVGDDLRVPARNAAVVQNDVVFLCPADAVGRAGNKIYFPAFARRIDYFKNCAHCF